ncbi:MAG: fibronectin type III domain-containing protein [Methylococcus sp.]
MLTLLLNHARVLFRSGIVCLLMISPLRAEMEVFKAVLTWGTEGVFNLPKGIAVDGSGNVYVLDTSNHRIQKFNPSGVYQSTIGGYGAADGAFSSPAGLALDSGGNLYVVDNGNSRIQKFTSSGQFLNKWGSSGNGNGQFNFGSAYDNIALDSSGNIYVVDSNNNRIQKFKPDGSFDRAWGTLGAADGQFSFPQGIAIAASDTVYVTDSNNHRIQKFSPTGAFLGKWGSRGNADGQFQLPVGMATHTDAGGSESVYVADTFNNRIQKFDDTGVFLGKITSGSGGITLSSPAALATDTSGNIYVTDNFSIAQKIDPQGTLLGTIGYQRTDDGKLRTPSGIAQDSSGNLYVADSGNNRIQKFNRQGKLLGKWGSAGSGDGQFSTPFSLTIDPAGNVYVVDKDNDRIQKFSSAGAFLQKWGSRGTANGQFFNLGGIASDSAGNVYVADAGNSRIQKFNSNGTFLLAWGSPGAADGQFSFPQGMATDAEDTLYVVDQGNRRIQKFSNQGILLGKWGSAGAGDGQFNQPLGIATGFDQNNLPQVYVSDSSSGNQEKSIQRFSDTGVFSTRWARSGEGKDELRAPYALSAWKATDNTYVYVADYHNNRVQVFAAVPFTPTDLAGTALSTTQLKLGWQDTSYNEKGFKLERCQGIGCFDFEQIASTASNVMTYTENGLAPGETYGYRVRAYNTVGDSAYSAPLSVTMPMPPRPPANLAAIPLSDSEIRLTWTDASNNEKGFKIERCQGANCTNFAQITTVGVNVTGYTNTGLTLDTVYRYRIRAYNDFADSAYTDIVTAKTFGPPAVPSGLSVAAIPNTSSKLSLSWTDPGNEESGFKLERCKGSGCTNFAEIETVPANTVDYMDKGLQANTLHRYRIRAYNGLGNSAYSNIASVKTNPLGLYTPTEPKLITWKKINPNLTTSWQTDITWTDNAGTETGFKVERCRGSVVFCNTALASYIVVKTIPATPGTDATTTYSFAGRPPNPSCFRIRAFRKAGALTLYSGYSTMVCHTR